MVGIIIIILLGALPGAAFYLVAQRFVGRP